MDEPDTSESTTIGGMAQRSSPALSPGVRVAGRFVIGARLGAGGFGEVYCATDETLRREIALKLLRAEAASEARDPGFERFLQEARAVARLDHPNIVPVYDAGVHDGRPWIAMKIVHGASIAELLAREGKIDPGRATRILSGVARALGHAHRRNVHHRDVKPSNILVGQLESGEEHAWLLDFGVARVLAGDSTWSDRAIAGTPAYLAPERILGKPTDGRADLFSLGCVAVEMMSGERAFDGDSVSEIVSKIIVATPRGLELVHRLARPRLADAIERALSKSPDDRFRDLDAFADALDDARKTRGRWLVIPSRRRGRDAPWDGRVTLEISGLTKGYSFRSKVLDDVSLTVPRGAVYALLGRNGTGKTTLIQTFLGTYRPDRGRVRVFGRDPIRDRVAVISRVGHVPTQLPAYESLRVGEFLRFVGRFREGWDESYAMHLLSRFAVPLDVRVRHLSHGMRTKVSLLAALCHRPDFLVLDDPTVGLDVVVIGEFFDALRETTRREGTTIFMATHQVDEVERLATDVGFLAAGRIMISGRLEELRAGGARVTATFPDAVPELLAAHGLKEVLLSGRRISGIATTDPKVIVERLRAQGAEAVVTHPLTLRDLFVASTR